MKRLLIAASLLLAVTVFPAATEQPIAVAASVHHSRPAHRSGCRHRFSLHAGIRYADRVYRGTHVATRHEQHRLWYIDKCQHDRHGRRFLRGVIRRHRAANAHRRYEASHPYSHDTASWYDDGGQTASGWHATYGVADCGSGGGPCYPFGTRIEFCYHGCVVATVDDHGPYVAGRAWDLGASTAQAIGFGGVGTVAWRRVS